MINNLADGLNAWMLTSTSEMDIKCCLIKDVETRGDALGTRDVLIVQVCTPPGGVLVLKTLKCCTQASDSNKVDVKCDIDEKLSSGSACVRNKWRDLNRKLTNQIKGGLASACAEAVVTGSNYECEEACFEWPKGEEPILNPIDPSWSIGLHTACTSSTWKDCGGSGES